MKKRLITLDICLNVCIPLFLGLIIYVLQRFFILTDIVKNHFPDFLWAYALLSFILIIWSRKVKIYWVVIAMISTILLEMLQYFHHINGIGDILDIVTYFIAFSLVLYFNKYFLFHIYLKPTTYEEN